ncbi:hypothetical protein PsorP6_010491 [Peronosclerospora sorghi]|uniref:Uncharacterized protein n=1 Tax=Peronosclerospora sorghi TaxID=230839 RepID=A0ACC0VUJ5_9STRA|nr:hypothetical protein PsorP6_010491 [Peronosclerospora sorghi]
MQLQPVAVMAMATLLYTKEAVATSYTFRALKPDQDADSIDDEDRGLRGWIFTFTRSKGTPLLASTSDFKAHADDHVAQASEKAAEVETSDASPFLSALSKQLREKPLEDILKDDRVVSKIVALKMMYPNDDLKGTSKYLREIFNDEELEKIIQGGKDSQDQHIKPLVDDLKLMLRERQREAAGSTP